jgi:hypothetical protein
MTRTFDHAIIMRAVDGDTFDIKIDLGFDVYHLTRVRIHGYYADELNSKDPAKAENAKRQWNEAKKLETKLCVIVVYRKEKYGRWESDVVVDGIKYGAITLHKIL